MLTYIRFPGCKSEAGRLIFCPPWAAPTVIEIESLQDIWRPAITPPVSGGRGGKGKRKKEKGKSGIIKSSNHQIIKSPNQSAHQHISKLAHQHIISPLPGKVLPLSNIPFCLKRSHRKGYFLHHRCGGLAEDCCALRN